MKLEFSSNRHSVYSLKYHLVLVTKYRHKCINGKIFDAIKDKTLELFEKWECTLIEMNHDLDHIHILFEAPPQVQLSKIINSYKTATSRLVRKHFEEHLKKFYWKEYFWNRSYLILSSGGAPIEVIKKYIEEQGKE
ncbi:MAG: transposase IS200-family protein [Anaerosolibacter sp.]|jgi:putative transposase|uniref:IS200/IS605 family transposase n=1 Tax=Anaerosolibacter sp. TaxID=1872527 RepID=UPI00261BE3B0|nr:IS200/IS605 family transposase [Anaerosolibacter sp.]MDF2545400.1 transposase IS200-family protein [Anaerosolibacter sp.]